MARVGRRQACALHGVQVGRRRGNPGSRDDRLGSVNPMTTTQAFHGDVVAGAGADRDEADVPPAS